MKKRTVLLTGASRGLGKAIYHRLEGEYHMIAPTREVLDLSDDESIAQYVAQLQDTRIDILINNAGINVPQWIEEMTDDNIEETIQINLTAPIKLIRAVARGMKKRAWGRIINISSAFGIVARGKQALYCATKHGINGATKALALELAPYNILVNAIAPGFARTDLVVKRNSKQKIARFCKNIPLKRLVEPDEIAEVTAFIISEKNSYMTGETIVVDGGFTIQ